MPVDANVVYLKTTNLNFYCMAHANDKGFTPHIVTLMTDNACQLVVASNFKLKTIRKPEAAINRIDIYMPPMSANSLGEAIASKYGKGDLNIQEGLPERTWNQQKHIPKRHEAYFADCTSISANVGGRALFCPDSSRVFLDSEDPRDDFTVMNDREVHIAFSFKKYEQMYRNNKRNYKRHDSIVDMSPSYIDDLRRTATKADIDKARAKYHDPPTEGFAAGSITITFNKYQASCLATALKQLSLY